MRRVCLVSESDPGGEERARALATCLSGRFAVEVVAPDTAAARPGYAFANEEHRRAAAVLDAIVAAYDGGPGPDYIEVPDRDGLGIVLLQARRGGSPLLAGARVGVRLTGSRELTDAHDGGAWKREATLVADLEREQLRLADLIVAPDAEALALYRRAYDDLPAAAVIAPEPVVVKPVGNRPVDGPVRLLYRGPLARHRGILELATALLRLPADGWRLTLAGPDTDTAPAGGSVRLTIEEMFGAAEKRVTFIDEPANFAAWAALHEEHDAFVAPGPIAVRSAEALAALGSGLPVLATPVGGIPALLASGAGWVAAGPGARDLSSALEEIVADPSRVAAARGLGVAAVRDLTDPERIASAYEELAAPPPARRPPAARRPSVTGVIPYHRTADYVEEAVESLLGQTYEDVDVILVNDGSFEPADQVLTRIAALPRVTVVTKLNAGDGSARTLGARLARGEYLVMLDADNVLEPTFVERTLPVLLAEPDLAYVTCWLRYIDAEGAPITETEGYAALGNGVVRDDSVNLDGDTLALFPRAVFAAQGYEYDPACATHSDWALYRTLRSEGRYGAVIPEPLANYRVRADSLLRTYSAGLIDGGPGEVRDRVLARRAAMLEET